MGYRDATATAARSRAQHAAGAGLARRAGSRCYRRKCLARPGLVLPDAMARPLPHLMRTISARCLGAGAAAAASRRGRRRDFASLRGRIFR